MGLSVQQGTLAQPGGTGNQSATGFGFQPGITLFWGTEYTATGAGTNALHSFSFGAAVDSGDYRAITANADYTATSDNAFSHDDTRCIKFISNAAAETAGATFVSNDTNGFTINWAAADATARLINYLSIGGTTLTRAKTGQFTKATATGQQRVTGIGFKPTAVIFFMATIGTAAPPQTADGNSGLEIGFARSSGQQNLSAILFLDNVATTANFGFATTRITTCWEEISAGGATASIGALVTMDRDGFTINWTTAAATATYIFYAAIQGPSIYVSSATANTSTGNQAITGAGFTPIAGLFTNISSAATGISASLEGNMSFGAMTIATARSAININADGDGEAADGLLDTTKVLRIYNQGTNTHSADFVSWDTDGFTINYSAATGTAYIYCYMLFGYTPTAGDAIALTESRQTFMTISDAAR